MSETKTPSSITAARSLQSDPEHKQRLLRQQGVTPARTIPQKILEKTAGGVQPGESSLSARRRGARRVVGAVALPFVVAASLHGLKEVKKGLEHVADSSRAAAVKERLQPLKDYQHGVKLKDGMVAVKSGNFEGTATEWARQHAANLKEKGAQDLIARVNEQANYQGDPGVQSNEVFVVPRSELTDETVHELGISER